ncbi:hypothetical protein [Campylobacter corcagiensis]|uniref:Periplasmic protein n=2 Tax=Campylobacter corcagiensis TaxID=1448857 RepID=A0A7M1LG91_9BACT|nr:hypothetical protein [Campylobacter corcagiensis]QOQ87343.1 hypothetical protein IMC76_00540 [Campylobacter corcagiensis]
MKKIIPVLVFLLIAGEFFWFINKPSKFNAKELGAHLSCHINIEDCSVKFGQKDVEISLNPKPLKVMIPTTLRLKNLGEYENLSVILKGVNMNMGKIESRFVKNGGIYEANVIFSACVGDMLYEGVLYSNGKPIGFKFEFLLEK